MEPGARISLLRRASLLSATSIGLSALIGLIAVSVALANRSLSLLGFGVDSAIDSAASIVLLWRFRIEVAHPHRAERVERLAEIAVGAVLLFFAVYLAINASFALSNHTGAATSVTSVALLLASLVLLPPLAVAKYRTATALRSGALRADSVLTGIAAALALVSLLSLVLSELFGLWWADAVGALIVAVVLAREAWAAFRSSSEPV